MKRTKRRRTLSLLLVIVLIASLFGLTAQAVGDGESITEPPATPVESPAVPAESPAPPTESPAAPAESPAPPTESPAAPAETPATPAESPAAPAESPADDESQQSLKKPEADKPELKDQTLTQTIDGVTVSVKGCLPVGVALRVVKVSNLGLGYANFLYAYDISLWLNGKEYQLTEAVSISIAGLILPSDGNCTFILQSAMGDDILFNTKGKTISFTTSCLSTFVLTVKDFDWNGCILGAREVAVGKTIELCSIDKLKLETRNHSWSSSDTNIATVNTKKGCGNEANVTGISEGKVTVTHTFEYWSGILCFGKWKTASETVDITVFSRALIVTKTFVGLSDTEISSLNNNFVISVKGTTCGSKTTTLRLTDVTPNNGVYTWTLTGIEAGNYTVCETGFNVDNYKVDSKVNCISNAKYEVVVTKFCTAKVAFVNTYTPVPPPTPDKGTLSVTKTFKDLPLDKIPDDFIITVNGSDCENKNETRTLNLTGLTPNDGVYTWTLSDLKPGNYTVTESGFQVAGYSVVYQVNNTTDTSTSVTISKCSAARVAFVNTYKQDTPPTSTGTLTVTKTFSGNCGNIPADFAIVVNGASYPLGEPSEGVYTWDITLPVGEYTVTETNTAIQGYTLDTSKSTTSVSGTLTTDGDSAALENVYSQCACRYVTVRYEYIDPVPTGAKPPNDGNPIEIPYNSPYDSITPTSIDGYKFDGWYVKNETPVESPAATISSFFVELFGKDDKFVDHTPVTSDIVLYGYWIKTYKVKYTWGTGAPSDAVLPSTASYEKDEEVEIAAAPTTLLSGWTFNGWKINGAPAADFTMGDSDVDIVGSWTQTIVYPPGVIYPDIPTSTEIPEESPPLNPSPSVSPDPGAEIPEEEVPHADAPVIPVDNNKPQTGDNSNLALMTILAALSSIGIGTVSIIGRRKKNSK